ncbi:hypothetical protein LSAT2_001660 [Lamellibrachia satsuma]|nr:hypothetical protein LSAT2_001660 [Lamellibrachia satsuma]
MDNGMGDAVDGMLTHENEEMKERVIALEKKVHEQEDELLCLKSALSDVIRRLSAVEANRSFQNNVLPSKPNFRGPPQRRSNAQSSTSPKQLIPMTASRGRTGSLEAVGGSPQRGTSPQPSKIVPRRSPQSPKSLRKWPSVPSSEGTSPNGPLTPTRFERVRGQLGGNVAENAISCQLSQL